MARVVQIAPIWIQKQMKKITHFVGFLHLHRHRHQRCRSLTTANLGIKPTKNNEKSMRGKEEAERINAQIRALCAEGRLKEALEDLYIMNCKPLQVEAQTYASLLQECINTNSLEKGKTVHSHMINAGFSPDVYLKTKLVIMYAKQGNLAYARQLFDVMSERNVVSWNAMVAGFSQNGHGEKALEFFQQMQAAGIMPISKTFAIILPVCANLGALEQAIEMHGNILRSEFQLDVTVVNALVHMYAKCGSIKRARKLFDKMHHQDEVSWNTMIEGYAMHGHGKEALNLFEEMKHSGMNPNHATFVSVLSACSHVGLVEEGYHYFNSMTECFHLMPAMEHHICMVDLLGRAGHLDEAQDFINKMRIKPDAVVWNCLLAACRIHSNIELGERVADHLLELEPESAAPYVLMSNIYAAAGRWSDIKNVRKVMKDRGLKKVPGCSWIEIDKVVHAFVLSS